MHQIKIIIVWVLAILFFINSLIISIKNNFTFGTIVLWLITMCLMAYGIFNKKIDNFFSHGFGKIVFIILLLGLIFFVGMFIFVAASGYTANAEGDEAAIIILGAGLNGEEVSNTLCRRLEAGLEEWQKNKNAYIVVTGGQGAQEVIPEAVAMQRWLIANGVDEDKIILEDKSVSTETNLKYALDLLSEKGIYANDKIAVCTNAFHCYRASKYAKMLGIENIRTIPASMGFTSILQSYIREIFAILYMWVFKRELL